MTNPAIIRTGSDERGDKIESMREKKFSTLGKKRTKSGDWDRDRSEKLTDRITTRENEAYRNCQALLLAFSILALSYHGLRHGISEYSILENGNIVNGFVSARRAVITFSFGYSVINSYISSVAAVMLLYSVFTKKPRWSLPAILIYMFHLFFHLVDALMAFWLFFAHLRPLTALLYTAIIVLIITAEAWIWLGVFRLFEYRNFQLTFPRT